MSENLTSRIKIGFTEEEKKKHETWARAHKISFSDLVRLALPFYERFNGENPTTGNDDKIAKQQAKREQELNDLYAKITEKIAQFQILPAANPADHDLKVKVIVNILKANFDGLTTGVIVSCTTWPREDVTEILLQLKKAEIFTKVKEIWNISPDWAKKDLSEILSELKKRSEE